MYTELDADDLSAPAVLMGPRLGADVYAQLKTRLLRGEFPLNLRLVETRLAESLGASRTPVREALARLAAESLVESHPDGGYRPTVPNTVMIRELYQVRMALELEASQRPARLGLRHNAEILEGLRDHWRALQSGSPHDPDPDFVLQDESFHVNLSLAVGNREAANVLRQINDRIRIVRTHDFLSSERIELTIAEHLGIVELILVGDLVAAECQFTAHLGESISVVEQRSVEAIRRMVAR